MKLSGREKILAGIVLGAVFLVLNLVIIRALVAKQALLRTELASRGRDLQTMKLLLSERDLWTKRAAWLSARQPPLTNESGAGVQLLEQIRVIAREKLVTLENPAFGTNNKTKWYRSVSVNVETKGSLGALVHFLDALQQPDQFIVLESADFAIDSADKSQMHGTFRIARWYAP